MIPINYLMSLMSYIKSTDTAISSVADPVPFGEGSGSGSGVHYCDIRIRTPINVGSGSKLTIHTGSGFPYFLKSRSGFYKILMSCIRARILQGSFVAPVPYNCSSPDPDPFQNWGIILNPMIVSDPFQRHS